MVLFDIPIAFVKQYENFLVQSTQVDPLESLGDIFINTLSRDEAQAMVCDVTKDEIKKAMFDIGDCKAPGPDGYTACFFKKAWSVVGEYVCLAVNEFFSLGILLKEINSTLISLIPKSQYVRLVTDFRPIACCNVLYKCISKF